VHNKMKFLPRRYLYIHVPTVVLTTNCSPTNDLWRALSRVHVCTTTQMPSHTCGLLTSLPPPPSILPPPPPPPSPSPPSLFSLVLAPPALFLARSISRSLSTAHSRSLAPPPLKPTNIHFALSAAWVEGAIERGEGHRSLFVSHTHACSFTFPHIQSICRCATHKSCHTWQ